MHAISLPLRQIEKKIEINKKIHLLSLTTNPGIHDWFTLMAFAFYGCHCHSCTSPKPLQGTYFIVTYILMNYDRKCNLFYNQKKSAKIMSFFTNPTDGYHIIFEILKTINTLPCMYRVLTLYNDILRIARNLLETRENIKIEYDPFLSYNLWLIFMEMKQRFCFFWKKNPKWSTQCRGWKIGAENR